MDWIKKVWDRKQKISHYVSYGILYILWASLSTWISFRFFSCIEMLRLYYFAQHLETLMIGGALIFFILFHFKVSVHFRLQYGSKEFFFLKILFYLIFNAVILYIALLSLYLSFSHPYSRYLISVLYSYGTMIGCLLLNKFFNLKAQLYFSSLSEKSS